MLNIKFVVDEDILARYFIHYSRHLPTDLMEKLLKEYKSSFIAIRSNINAKDIDEEILRTIKESWFFNDFIQSAKENRTRIEANFKETSNVINEYLKKIFKTEVDIPTQTAYIASTMFKLQMGGNIHNNRFVWGHRKGKEDKNYDLVYLVHESLHSIFERNALTHTIIENIADIGLCRVLSNGNKNQYDTFDTLKPCHEKIFPYWNLYLNKSKEEIQEEIKISGFNYDQLKYEHLREHLKNMNIFDFINFCSKTLNFEEAKMTNL